MRISKKDGRGKQHVIIFKELLHGKETCTAERVGGK